MEGLARSSHPLAHRGIRQVVAVRDGGERLVVGTRKERFPCGGIKAPEQPVNMNGEIVVRVPVVSTPDIQHVVRGGQELPTALVEVPTHDPGQVTDQCVNHAAPEPFHFREISLDERAVEEFEAHRAPFGRVVLEQRSAEDDEQRPVGGREPSQGDRITSESRGHEPPVTGSVVEAGPVDVGEEIAGAAAAQQPGGLASAVLALEGRSSGG